MHTQVIIVCPAVKKPNPKPGIKQHPDETYAVYTQCLKDGEASDNCEFAHRAALMFAQTGKPGIRENSRRCFSRKPKRKSVTSKFRQQKQGSLPVFIPCLFRIMRGTMSGGIFVGMDKNIMDGLNAVLKVSLLPTAPISVIIVSSFTLFITYRGYQTLAATQTPVEDVVWDVGRMLLITTFVLNLMAG
jgi:hypothetical protein